MQKEGGKISEMTPSGEFLLVHSSRPYNYISLDFSELYEIFVEISRVKFHVLLTYNYDDKEAKRLLRMHKSILCASTQINLKVMPCNRYLRYQFCNKGSSERFKVECADIEV